MRTRLCLIAVLAWQFFATPVFAVTPREELLRLVPDDTAICFVVQGLRDRAITVAESPLSAWVKERYQPLLGKAPEMDKLKDLETLFSTFIGVTLNDLREDIFGDAIVLAYQTGTVQKPETEQGFILLKARDPKKLAKLIEKLNLLQKASGELAEIQELTHAGQKYFKRAKSNDTGEFYLLKDDLFAFAAHESAIHTILDRHAESRKEPNFVTQSIEKLGVQNSFLLCWFNPRKLDREVQAHINAAPNAQEKATRKQFAQVWSALDNIAIYLDANKQLELGVATSYRADAMPPELKTLLSKQPRASALWQVIPDDALFAMAGRMSGADLLAVLLSLTPNEDRAKTKSEIEKVIGSVVGKDKFASLLNGLGPDYGIWAIQPKSESWLPQLTATVRLNDPAVAPAALKLMNFYILQAQVEYNRNHEDQVESQTENDLTIFTNEQRFPTGFRPSFATRESYLILGISPERVQSFRKPTKEEPPTEEVPFVRINGAALQSFLREHGKPVSSWLAQQNNRPLEDVQKEISTLAEAIQVLERAELFIRSDTKVTRFAVRFQFVKPLAK
jgi:hypothetical protein